MDHLLELMGLVPISFFALKDLLRFAFQTAALIGLLTIGGVTMLTVSLNIFLGIVGIYAALKLAGIAMDWVKEGLDCLKPPRRPRDRR